VGTSDQQWAKLRKLRKVVVLYTLSMMVTLWLSIELVPKATVAIALFLIVVGWFVKAALYSVRCPGCGERFEGGLHLDSFFAYRCRNCGLKAYSDQTRQTDDNSSLPTP
jgi:hypothetical protein